MRTLDLSPLYRSTVGFDHLGRVLELLQDSDGTKPYPPYNIEKTGEDGYRIVMAVAGVPAEALDLVVTGGVLSVRGKGRDDQDQTQYLHHGLAFRAFERRFQLADTLQVTQARLENGLLLVDLVRRVPEALKPRRVAIATGPAAGQAGQADEGVPLTGQAA